MQIVGFEQVSTIDFPGTPAMVLYAGRCNLRCPYCYNYTLVLDDTGRGYTMEEIMENVRKIKSFIEGVVITGGEPTLYPDLGILIKAIKSEGLKVKLDTNGTNPELIKEVLPLLDYIAMDVKSDAIGYLKLGATPEMFTKILESIKIIKKSKNHEFRITCVHPFLTVNNYMNIGLMIKGAKKFVLQKANLANVLDPNFNQSVITDLKLLAERFKYYADEIVIRE